MQHLRLADGGRVEMDQETPGQRPDVPVEDAVGARELGLDSAPAQLRRRAFERLVPETDASGQVAGDLPSRGRARTPYTRSDLVNCIAVVRPYGLIIKGRSPGRIVP